MRKFLSVLPVKIICFFLTLISIAVTSFSGIYLYTGYNYNVFNSDEFNFFDTPVCSNMLSSEADLLVSSYAYSPNNYPDFSDQYYYRDTNLAVYVYKIENGIDTLVFYNNKIAGEIGASSEVTVSVPHDTSAAFKVILSLDSKLSVNDSYKIASDIYENIYNNKIPIAAAFLISSVITLLFFSFMCVGAGRKNGKVTITAFTKMPFLLVLLIVMSIATAFVYITSFNIHSSVIYYISHIYLNSSKNVYTEFSQHIVSLAIQTSVFLMFTVVPLILTVCARVKAASAKLKPFWKNFALLLLFNYIWKKIKSGFFVFSQNIPAVIVGASLFLVYIFINVLFISYMQNGFSIATVMCLLYNICVLIIICLFFKSLDNLRKETLSIAQGDLDTINDAENYLPFFKKYIDAINSTKVGMSVAIEKSLKSERLKTELITNVSHDLKTPLTSIINYIDLLKGENLTDENAKEYIDILESQSNRLKKLIEDLLEISKASTGNIKVNLSSIDINEFINQINGEFFDRLENSGLTAVISPCEENLFITADGTLLWRIFNNLISNICKYSMPGTRVYFSAATRAENPKKAEIIVRNISSAPLNISPQELTERFVRGDSSRNTEGSGLGLSIAKSLTEAQNGSFDISIDGDLFKVTLVFTKQNTADMPKAVNPEPSEDRAENPDSKSGISIYDDSSLSDKTKTFPADCAPNTLYMDAEIE